MFYDNLIFMSSLKQTGWISDSYKYDVPEFILNGNWKTNIVTYALIDEIPKLPGFYIYTAQIKSGSGILSAMKTIMYVGIAGVNGSLQQRYKSHFRKPKFKRCMETYLNKFEYSYILASEDEYDNLRSYEQFIINIFGPPLNDINSKASEVIKGTILT